MLEWASVAFFSIFWNMPRSERALYWFCSWSFSLESLGDPGSPTLVGQPASGQAKRHHEAPFAPELASRIAVLSGLFDCIGAGVR